MKKASTRAALVCATALPCAALIAGCEAVSFVPAVHIDAMESNLRLLVVAELREAQRLGLVTTGEEDVPSISEAHSRLISQAVEEATVGEVIAAR
jgi:hypothetical protein